MKQTPDSNINAYAASILSKHFQALIIEINGVRQAQDIEYIHRMRVASRRLRNALEIFSFCFNAKTADLWQKKVRKITSSLGEARDRDVQINSIQNILDNLQDRKLKLGLKRLQLRLKQDRAKLQANLNKSLDDLSAGQELVIFQSQIDALSPIDVQPAEYAPALHLLAWETIIKRLNDFTSYEGFVDDIDNVEELHDMRIAAKKLRYSMEVFAPLYPHELKTYIQAVRQFQDLLGNLHDCEVWIDYLPKFLIREQKRIINFYGAPRGITLLQAGINYFSNLKIEERENIYQTFFNTWHKRQTQSLWLELTNTIKAPLLIKPPD